MEQETFELAKSLQDKLASIIVLRERLCRIQEQGLLFCSLEELGDVFGRAALATALIDEVGDLVGFTLNILDVAQKITQSEFDTL